MQSSETLDIAELKGVYDLTSGRCCGSKFLICIMTSPICRQGEDMVSAVEGELLQSVCKNKVGHFELS